MALRGHYVPTTVILNFYQARRIILIYSRTLHYNSCGAANYNKLIAYYNNFVITVAPNKMVLRVIGTAEQSFKIKKKTLKKKKENDVHFER